MELQTIDWQPNTYRIGGKPGFLISGEFHYFRVPRQEWENRLKLFIEAGGNCVGTYIPWILHEPVEGDVRFGDKPERDLDGFLSLCRDLGLYVIGRPGPYQYSELAEQGLPPNPRAEYPTKSAETETFTIIRRRLGPRATSGRFIARSRSTDIFCSTIHGWLPPIKSAITISGLTGNICAANIMPPVIPASGRRMHGSS